MGELPDMAAAPFDRWAFKSRAGRCGDVDARGVHRGGDVCYIKSNGGKWDSCDATKTSGSKAFVTQAATALEKARAVCEKSGQCVGFEGDKSGNVHLRTKIYRWNPSPSMGEGDCYWLPERTVAPVSIHDCGDGYML